MQPASPDGESCHMNMEMPHGFPVTAVGRCTLNQVDPKPITYRLSNP
jgi:hypothetical protein